MRLIHGSRLKRGKIVDYKFEIASSWDELTTYQHVHVIKVLRQNADRFTKTACLLAILYQDHWDILSDISDDDLHGLAPLTNFIFDEKPPVTNPFPMIRSRKKEYFAPGDDLGNLVFGEFCFAYQFQKDYREFDDVKILDKLLGTIYRLKDPAQVPDSVDFRGDIREIFNENTIDHRARQFADVPFMAKLAIYTWFISALYLVMEARPKTFPLTNPQDTPLDEPDQDAGRTWLTVFRELIGPKWGTQEQLKFTNAMFVLDGLEDARIEYEKTMAPRSS